MDRTRVREFRVSDSRNLGKPFQTSMMYFASFCGYYTTVRLGRNCLSLGRRRNKIIVCDYTDYTYTLHPHIKGAGQTEVAACRGVRDVCFRVEHKHSGMTVIFRPSVRPFPLCKLSSSARIILRGHQTQTRRTRRETNKIIFRRIDESNITLVMRERERERGFRSDG